ncbi:MAG: DNA-processing protein DprA [bacterium]|nr:DNA-processing protein DprA [bacterium]
MTKDAAYIALNGLATMTARRFWKLLRGEKDPIRIFSSSEAVLVARGVPVETARRICAMDPEAFARHERKRVGELGGRIVIHGDSAYPGALAEIDDPPPVLYVQGRLRKEDALALAIVGSRSASTQGRLNAERLAARLAAMGMTIVSGLAMGIDTWAHQGALDGGGRTVAVLGCGLDQTYPASNQRLRKKIVSRGAVISEFPLGTAPLPMNFPRRNRIISGIALGTLVVEAARKSGSLITARFALEQGREVFAIPGTIQASRSQGGNLLIQKGAKLVQSADDIVEEFPDEIRRYLTLEKVLPRKAVTAGKDEAAVLRFIGDEPVHIDALTRETELRPAAMASLLTRMELKGLVRQLPGKLFTKPSGSGGSNG